MGSRLRPTRYAHCEGHTDVCYSEDGRLLVTCGEDGEVRVFQGLDDDDCLTHTVGEKVHAISYKFPNLVVGHDSNCVQYFDPEDGAPGQVVSRFTAHPTCIDINGKLIAAGASDMVVRVLDTVDYQETVLEGHAAPILSVALDPKGEYLASSSCDGSIKIWFINTATCVKTLPDLHPKSNQFKSSSTLCRMTFTSSGSHLLVPVVDKVTVYERTTWTKERQFGHPDSAVPLSIIALSYCGSLVTTCTRDGQISIFNLSSGSLVTAVQHPKKLPITGLAWNPAKDKTEIAFVDSQGQLGTVVDFTSDQVHDSSSKAADAATVFPPADVDATMDEMLAEINNDDFTADFDAGGDSEDDNEISLAKIKTQMGFADDEHGTFLGLAKNEVSQSAATAVPPTAPLSLPPTLRLPELQRCFTPSMTPEHHSQRYMVWNNAGIVKQYNTEEDASISVEFHDTSLHHSIYVPNGSDQLHTYGLAALAEQVLVLGAESSGDTPSHVSVQLLSASGQQQDWDVDLPAGEDCIAVAASNNMVCVASSRRILRVYSIGGACREVLCVPGQLVCMSVHRHKLALLYHAGTGAGGDQQIHLLLIDTDCRHTSFHSTASTTNAPVALSPGSFVAWAGFSDEGTPVVIDSDGYIRVMDPRYPGVWTVILATKDMTKGRSDHHFVLGVSETEAKVRSILCKGSRYPPVVPPPYVTLLDFKVPVFDQSSEKGGLESTALLSEFKLTTLRQQQHRPSGGNRALVESAMQETEVLLQTTLMKLFALSCRSGREQRAMDLCHGMSDRTLAAAAVYAGKLGLVTLAEALAELREEQRERDEELQLTGLPALNDRSSLSLAALTPLSGASRGVRLADNGDINQHDDDDGSDGQREDGSDEDDVVAPTQLSVKSSNPLLAAAARRNKNQLHHNLSLDTSMAPSKVNPFKKSMSSRPSEGGPGGGSKRVLEVLDDYRPKPETSSVPILRPVLKKKSKSERTLNKPQPSKSSITSAQPKLPNSFSMGKENKLLFSPANENLPDVTASPADDHNIDSNIKGGATNTDEDKDACNGDTPDSNTKQTIRNSSLFKDTVAMHLWWADNEDMVIGNDTEKELKLLVPKAAMMFLEISDEEKTKYKELARDNTARCTEVKGLATDTASLNNADNKRKRDDDDCSASPSTGTGSSTKKPKQGSGISKLAAFAFNRS